MRGGFGLNGQLVAQPLQSQARRSARQGIAQSLGLDGTLSLFTTALDHAGPVEWDGDLSPNGLAGLSRQFAANDWVENPSLRIGTALDRNTELLIPAPFDMAVITDAGFCSPQGVAALEVELDGGLPRSPLSKGNATAGSLRNGSPVSCAQTEKTCSSPSA